MQGGGTAGLWPQRARADDQQCRRRSGRIDVSSDSVEGLTCSRGGLCAASAAGRVAQPVSRHLEYQRRTVARPEDVGTQLFALTRSDIKQTTLVGVTGTLIFDGVQMTGLLLTEDVTSPGDSGCCLVDASFRVWGLLVGVALVDGVVRFVFASANFVMALENARLA